MPIGEDADAVIIRTDSDMRQCAKEGRDKSPMFVAVRVVSGGDRSTIGTVEIVAGFERLGGVFFRFDGRLNREGLCK